MEILKTLLWVVQIISAITIVVLVLLQQGKGADAGATFGSGGLGCLLVNFGAGGSGGLLVLALEALGFVARLWRLSWFAS